MATVNAQAVAGGDSNAAAKAALDAAKRELDRLEPLHADRLVTDDVYNAAGPLMKAPAPRIARVRPEAVRWRPWAAR